MDDYIHNAVTDWASELAKNPKYRSVYDIAQGFEDAVYTTGIRCEVEIAFSDSNLTEDQFAIGGTWTPGEVTREFELLFHFHSTKKEKGIYVDRIWLDKFIREAVSVSLHEYRHWEQDDHRGNNPVVTEYRNAKNTQERYLGNTDEIDAYAVGIAYSLRSLDDLVANRIIRNPEHILKDPTLSLDLYEYVNVFGASSDHVVMRKLYKKIAAHLLTDT